MEKAKNPIPQGKYVPATRFGNLIATAGMTPRENGVLLFEGKIRKDAEVSEYRSAVRLAAKNALTAASNMLAEGERISQVMTITVYLNAEDGYTKHAKVADFASEYLCEELKDAGICSRTSIGVASLPGNAPCEIQLLVGCTQD